MGRPLSFFQTRQLLLLSDKDVGQFPMAYVVRKSGCNLSESAVMDFIAKQVAPYKRMETGFCGFHPKESVRQDTAEGPDTACNL